MAGKNTAVFGIYPNYGAVESAVDALKMAGFRNTDISVLFPENVGTKDFAHTKATKAPEGATTGAGTGAVVGGALGWSIPRVLEHGPDVEQRLEGGCRTTRLIFPPARKGPKLRIRISGPRNLALMCVVCPVRLGRNVKLADQIGPVLWGHRAVPV